MWALYILSLTNNRCAKCGVYGCQAAHIVGRDDPWLRHHKKNGIPLCPACHNWADDVDPDGFKEWLLQNYPDRHAMYLAQWGKSKGPMRTGDLEAIIADLTSSR